MTSDEAPPRVFVNRFADAVGPGPQARARQLCRCGESPHGVLFGRLFLAVVLDAGHGGTSRWAGHRW
ncbi:hypothetical protein AB0C31_50740, partial [Actinoplanes philippinensis]